jgi:hypothetical protein
MQPVIARRSAVKYVPLMHANPDPEIVAIAPV